MEYTIEKNNNGVLIYPSIYTTRILHYKDLENLLVNYTVFNESIFQCQNDLKNIR